MRLFNNTSYRQVDPTDLAASVWHLVKCTVANIEDIKSIESLEINDKTFTAFGIDCVLAESNIENKTVEGVVRIFDELSGEGFIRLDNGLSVHFYSCNVEGANSLYPQLVSNIQLKQGDRVTAVVSSDPYMFSQVGLCNITRKAV